MKFVTNRASSYAMRSNSSQYTAADLNRVESMVKYLAFISKRYIPNDFAPTTKINWGELGPFSVDSWNVLSQMERYLANVKSLCDATGVEVDLPESMRFLTKQGADQIEKALEAVYNEISQHFDQYQYSGELYAGEENGL